MVGVRGNAKYRNLVALISLFLPWPLKRHAYRWFLGYDVSDLAHVGFSFISAERVRLEGGSRIGHLNIVRGLTVLSLGSNSRIGNANWLTAYPRSGDAHFELEPNRLPGLQVEKEATITSLHILDCTNMITIGQASVVGGWRSQILTHAIDFAENLQRSAPVVVGAYSFIGTGSTLLPGSRFPAHSVLGAHSCVSDCLLDEYWLYGGVPARPIKRLPPTDRYFGRESGHVK